MVGFPVMKVSERSAGFLCRNPFVQNYNLRARINLVLALLIVRNKEVTNGKSKNVCERSGCTADAGK